MFRRKGGIPTHLPESALPAQPAVPAIRSSAALHKPFGQKPQIVRRARKFARKRAMSRCASLGRRAWVGLGAVSTIGCKSAMKKASGRLASPALPLGTVPPSCASALARRATTVPSSVAPTNWFAAQPASGKSSKSAPRRSCATTPWANVAPARWGLGVVSGLRCTAAQKESSSGCWKRSVRHSLNAVSTAVEPLMRAPLDVGQRAGWIDVWTKHD